MTSRPASAPPTRPDGARRAARLIALLALVPAMAMFPPGSAGAAPETAPGLGSSLVATAPASTVSPAAAATPGPTAQMAPTPAPTARTGLAEPRSRRNIGLPASVAVVFIAGVGWGLVRARRLVPVDNRGKPSGHRRTVAR